MVCNIRLKQHSSANKSRQRQQRLQTAAQAEHTQIEDRKAQGLKEKRSATEKQRK